MENEREEARAGTWKAETECKENSFSHKDTNRSAGCPEITQFPPLDVFRIQLDKVLRNPV